MSDSTSTYAAPTYSASMPRSQIPTPSVVTGADPKPKTFLTVSSQTYPVIYEAHAPATNVVSTTRPIINVLIVTYGDNPLDLLKASISGSTVALMLPSGAVVTMQAPKIEVMKFVDDEFPDYPWAKNGSRLCFLKLSADSKFYRST